MKEIEFSQNYLSKEWRSFDVLVTETNGNFVFSWCSWEVIDGDGSILVVFVVDLRGEICLGIKLSVN
jgi:hypothetical protein